MKNILFGLIILTILINAGCVQEESQECVQVETSAQAPTGECEVFPTPCDIPKGYTLVEKCEPEIPVEPIVTPEPVDLCAGITCEDNCRGTTKLLNGTCVEGTCIYDLETDNSKDCGYVAPVPQKYDFDANLVFCEFNSLFEKYTLFYQIRNRTDNRPTYKSSIWLKVPELEYAQKRTIQSKYEKDKILWEDQQYSYLSTNYRGQYWEIRNLDTNMSLDFQLIFCEPEFSEKEDCTLQNGILIVEGNTAELCRIVGQ